MTSLPLFALGDIYWHLPIMIVLISLVYSATRFERWDNIGWETLRWIRNMGLFLVLIAVGLFVLSLFI
jgi:hypothetical protein